MEAWPTGLNLRGGAASAGSLTSAAALRASLGFSVPVIFTCSSSFTSIWPRELGRTEMVSRPRLSELPDRPLARVSALEGNLVNSPQRYFHNGDLVREFIAKLGPQIRGVHAKDTHLEDRLTTHLNDARPGLGELDYRVLLTELDRLDADLPLMLEHLPEQSEYELAAAYVRGVAQEIGVDL